MAQRQSSITVSTLEPTTSSFCTYYAIVWRMAVGQNCQLRLHCGVGGSPSLLRYDDTSLNHGLVMPFATQAPFMCSFNADDISRTIILSCVRTVQCGCGTACKVVFRTKDTRYRTLTGMLTFDVVLDCDEREVPLCRMSSPMLSNEDTGLRTYKQTGLALVVAAAPPNGQGFLPWSAVCLSKC